MLVGSTRRELAPGHAPLIFDRETLRTPAHYPCRPKYTVTVPEWLRRLSFVLPRADLISTHRRAAH